MPIHPPVGTLGSGSGDLGAGSTGGAGTTGTDAGLPTIPTPSCPPASIPLFQGIRTGRERVLCRGGQLYLKNAIAYCFLRVTVNPGVSSGTYRFVKFFLADKAQVDLWDVGTVSGRCALSETASQGYYSSAVQINYGYDWSTGASGGNANTGTITPGWVDLSVTGTSADPFVDAQGVANSALIDPANWSTQVFEITGAWIWKALETEVLLRTGYGSETGGATRADFLEYESEGICRKLTVMGSSLTTSGTTIGIPAPVGKYILGAGINCTSTHTGGQSWSSTPTLAVGAVATAIDDWRAFSSSLPVNAGMDSPNTSLMSTTTWGTAKYGSLALNPPPSGTSPLTGVLVATHEPRHTVGVWATQVNLPAPSDNIVTAGNLPSAIGLPTVAGAPSGAVIIRESGTTAITAANNEITEKKTGGTKITATYYKDFGTGFVSTLGSSSIQSSDYAPTDFAVRVRWAAQAESIAWPRAWCARVWPAWDAIKLTESSERVLAGAPFTLQGSSDAPAYNTWHPNFIAAISTDGTSLRITRASGYASNAGVEVWLPSFADDATTPSNPFTATQGIILEDRYIAVRCRSIGAAGKSFRLRLNGIEVAPSRSPVMATITTGAADTWVEREIDIASFGESGAPLTDGRQWWDNNIAGAAVGDSLRGWIIDQLSPGATVEIEWIKGKRKTAGRVTCLNPASSITHPVGSTAASNIVGTQPESSPYCESYLTAFTDGWPSLRPYRTARPDQTSYWGITGATLSQLIADINATTPPSYYGLGGVRTPVGARRWCGWTATDLATPRSGKPVFDGSAGVLWLYEDAFDSDTCVPALGGDGLIVTWDLGPEPAAPGVGGVDPVTPGDAALTLQCDWAAGESGCTLKAQYPASRISLYPGAGDVGAQGKAPGSYGDYTLVWFQAISGGQLIGHVVGEDVENPEVTETRETDGTVVVSPARDRGVLAVLPDAGGFAVGNTLLRGRRLRVPPTSPSVPQDYLGWLREFGNEVTDGYGLIEPLPRQRVFVRTPSGIDGLDHLHGVLGTLWVAYPNSDGKISVKRCPFASPSTATPFDLTALATEGPNDKEPSLILEKSGRLRLLFVRGSDVFQTHSDDDGATWEEPAVAFTNGKHPRGCTDTSGGVLRAAWKAGGELHGDYQSLGDASPSAEFTFQRHDGSSLVPLLVKNDAFSLSQGASIGGELTLWCIVQGESEPSMWVSYDSRYQTWTRVS